MHKTMKISAKILLPVLLVPAIVFSIYAFNRSEPGEGMAAESAEPFVPSESFDNYWYQGKGELNGYELEQARYGDIHKGNAVLVFVTEDFSTQALTKADGKNGPSVPVLKVNFDKKFLTGIYPYSMIMTVASPVDINRYPRPLKVATSSQEWCGHTYTQFNLRGKEYEFTEHSYFPGEGDQEERMKAVMLEDEIWTKIRIAPGQLPTGQVEMIPGTFYLRLRHQQALPEKATASLQKGAGGEMIYSLKYASGRRLEITVEANSPHKILGWEESYITGWGDSSTELVTRARLKKSTLLDYWSRNGNGDRQLRKSIGMDPECL